jgi:hypothetical protein
MPSCPQYFAGGVRLVGSREEWTRKSKSFAELICGSGSHQSPERNPKRYSPFDVMSIEGNRSNSPPQWTSCSALAETKKVVRLPTVQ